MNRKWIEHVKTISLTSLILLSFILTGYLLYSAPSFEENREEGFLQPPYIGDKKNNQQSVYELTSPSQIIAHHQGVHSLSLPEQKEFIATVNTLRAAELTDFSLLQPTPEQWKLIFQESQGVELQFHDTTIGQLDALFKFTTLRDQPVIQDLKQISRIFLYTDPKSQKVSTWFVSDQTKTIVQAQTEGINSQKLNQQIAAITSKNKTTFTPYPINDKPPWDENNKDVPFSPILYLPNQRMPVERITYPLRTVDIENLKQWLFKDPSVTPVQLNSTELLYMYNDPNMYNDQIITYNKQKNTMVYTNAPTLIENQTMLIREELAEINQFIQRHRGWTNFYTLEQIKTEDHANEYTFRLFMNHLPVYWKAADAQTLTPDTIQFQVKKSSISKYARSMYFLSTEPISHSQTSLPDQKQLTTLLQQKKLSLNKVKKLYPGYQAKQSKKNQATLIPTWVVETLDGKRHLLTSQEQEG